MRGVLFLGAVLGVFLCFIGAKKFEEARMIRIKTDSVMKITRALNKERDALAQLKELPAINVETVYSTWSQDISLLAAMRRVSCRSEIKNKETLFEQTSWPGVKKRQMEVVFSNLERGTDITGVLAGVDDLTRGMKRLPVVVDELRYEKNVLWMNVSLFGTEEKKYE